MFNGAYKVSEGTAARRRVYMQMVDATDGITPETGEAGGQPQYSKNGAAWGNTSATLTAVGNGRYYVELTTGELDTLGKILVRYKSANTAEAVASGEVVAYDPYSSTSLGLSRLDADISSRTAPGDIPTEAEIADAVWDESRNDHLTTGTTGAALGTAETGGEIIIASSPVSTSADGASVSPGVNVSGAFSNTATDDDNRYVNRPDASGLAVVMTFPAGTGNIPTSVQVQGFWNGSGQSTDVYALNNETATYDKLSNSSTRMNSKSNDTAYSYLLSRAHIADDGTVTIKFASASTNTAHRLHLDLVLVYFVPVAVASGGSGISATPQQIWEYASRTLTTSTGDPEPVDVAGIADAVWDEVVDGSVTARQSLRLANSANGGKLSGAATTNVLIRDLADSKNRVDATVDADGNRTATTLDLT